MTKEEAADIFLTTERDPLAVRMLKESHILIGGTNGSGKSTMINTFIHTVATYRTYEISYCIIDLKIVSLMKWKRDPHCQIYAETPEEALDLLEAYHDTMMERFKEMKENGQSEYKGQAFYLIIGECVDLLDTVPCSYEILKEIARLGKAANMHLLLATKLPDSISAALAVNITGLLALRCRSAAESEQIMGYKGAELLPRYGKGLYLCPELMAPETVDIKLTSDEEIDRIIDAYLRLREKD